MPRRIPTYRPPGSALIPSQATRKPAGDWDRLGNTRFLESRLWRRFRAAYLRAHPLCADCEEQGRVAQAAEVHHVRKRRDDPHGEQWLDEDNCRGLCKPCHSARTGRGE